MVCSVCNSKLHTVLFEINGVLYSIHFCEYCVRVSQVMRVMNN